MSLHSLPAPSSSPPTFTVANNPKIGLCLRPSPCLFSVPVTRSFFAWRFLVPSSGDPTKLLYVHYTLCTANPESSTGSKSLRYPPQRTGVDFLAPVQFQIRSTPMRSVAPFCTDCNNLPARQAKDACPLHTSLFPPAQLSLVRHDWARVTPSRPMGRRLCCCSHTVAGVPDAKPGTEAARWRPVPSRIEHGPRASHTRKMLERC